MADSDKPVRKIIHVDMDAFYASVEQRDDPSLKGKPVAVGGGHRGVVTAASYEARPFGVRSAMPSVTAKRRCPDLIFVKPRFDVYKTVSLQIRAIFAEHTPVIEPLSLDEAYLDVTASERFAWDIAKEIRARIRAETGLTASAGVAPNKMLAKIASDWRKPDGQFAILPDQITAFMAALPVRKVWGIGPKSAERFAARGIHTCGDLQAIPLAEMIAHHGKWGEELYRLCRGLDDRAVEPNRPRKSLSNESTFAENLPTLAACLAEIETLAEELLLELRQKAADRAIRKAFVKIKYADFTRTTRECVCAQPSPDVFRDLLREAHARRDLPVRLLGTGVRFVDEAEPKEAAAPSAQLDLFT